MRLFQRLAACVVAAAVSVAGPAAADDSALNREGFWTVGRGDADATACLGSLPTKSGAMFMLRAEAGQVGFAVGAKTPLRNGKTAELATEAYSFEFTPVFSRGGVLMTEGAMNARALAALRLAAGLIVRLDGREVFNANVEKTGLEGALDAVIACSKGESGWWGPGVGAKVAAREPEPEPPMNKEGLWSLRADGDSCVSALVIEGGLGMVLIATNGGGDVMVGAGSDAGFKRGRKGVFQTDAYSFAFRPDFSGDTYLQLDKFLDSQGLFALRRAKSLAILIDGQEVVSAVVEDSGLPQLVADLTACAAGDKGWWGEGAKLR